MKLLPDTISQTIEFFEKLPGIGPKTARRLGFYLLRMPQEDLETFANNIAMLKHKAHYCENCHNLTEEKICSLCADSQRDQATIAVVEDVLDLISMESGRQYNGLYHVLHGRIDPLNYVGPDDLKISELVTRVKNNQTQLHELILATNPDTEGEATAMYIKKQLEPILTNGMKITRLAYGLPIGADLEYTDYMTLSHALSGRRSY